MKYQSPSLGAFLHEAKAMSIPYIYTQEDNGAWSCWTNPEAQGLIKTHGAGETLQKAIDDFIAALKDIAESIYSDYRSEDENIRPEFLVKILVSSKEELMRCLDGKICDDF